MPIWRNFFLGAEPERGWGPLKRYDIDFAKHTVREELGKMGIDVRDPDQPVGTMSGGERQSPLMALAVGLVTSEMAQFADIREITEIAAAERRKDAAALAAQR